MANKRALKRTINIICEGLFNEAVAASLYGSGKNKDNTDAIVYSIAKMHHQYTCRVCHPEPGLKPKSYFLDLREKFSAEACDIIDQINNL